MGFVLGENAYFPDIGIDAVGQGEIDNPEFPAERNRGFCTPVRKSLQPASPPACKDQGQRIVGEAANETCGSIGHDPHPKIRLF